MQSAVREGIGDSNLDITYAGGIAAASSRG
jgi:hypothetical protein